MATEFHKNAGLDILSVPADGSFSEDDRRAMVDVLPLSLTDEIVEERISEVTICYPEIALNAVTVATNNMVAATAKNLSFGGGNLYVQSNGAQTSAWVKYDLGAGNERTVDYIALRRVNLLTAANEGFVRVLLRGSNDNFVSEDITVFDFQNLTTADLLNGKDLFSRLGEPSEAFRWWRVIITSGAPITMRLGKAYFGRLVDFGRSPVYPYQYSYFNSGEAFVSDAGAMFKSQNRSKKRRFELTWKNITDAVRNNFDLTVGQYLDAFQVAVHNLSDSEHRVLSGQDLVWGYATYENKSGVWANLNDIQVQLIEDIV